MRKQLQSVCKYEKLKVDKFLTTDFLRKKVKLLRAYGGCLGAKSRRRTG